MKYESGLLLEYQFQCNYLGFHQQKIFKPHFFKSSAKKSWASFSAIKFISNLAHVFFSSLFSPSLVTLMR